MSRLFFILVLLFLSVDAKNFSFRKYEHVRVFYSEITLDVIEVAKKYNLPPAAILAMAGLESGYGSGYVSQITGNILSLGAYKSDKELPRLYLPYSKSKKKVLYDAKVIAKQDKSDLSWRRRPPSLKRDYRVKKYAGSINNLDLLKYDAKLRNDARLACFKDFATRWISKDSNVKVYKDIRLWLDAKVAQYGVKILFTKEINEEFIDKIGGHPNSFNYRKSWPKKVKLIMNRVGLVELTNDIYFKKMSFSQAWQR